MPIDPLLVLRLVILFNDFLKIRSISHERTFLKAMTIFAAGFTSYIKSHKGKFKTKAISHVHEFFKIILTLLDNFYELSTINF